MRKVFAIATDKGNRPLNENAYYCNPDSGLFILSDGMGGRSCGDDASNLIVKSMTSFIEHASGDSEATMFVERKPGVSMENQYLTNACDFSNKELIKEANASGRFLKMGACVAGVYMSKRYMSFVSVGDTGVFLFRDKKIKKISMDETLDSYLMLDNARREQQIPIKFMGMDVDTSFSARDERLKEDDIVVIMTGSVHKSLTVNDIALIISEKTGSADKEGLERAATELISSARGSGNSANMTVVLARNGAVES